MRYFLKISKKKIPLKKGKIPILLIGEAPGENEIKEGVPFVGKAGKFLKKIFKEEDLNLDDFWITNVFDKRLEKPPTIKEIKSCIPRIKREVEEANPELILALGRVAEEALDRAGMEYISAPHPAASLIRKDLEKDTRKVLREVKERYAKVAKK